MCALCLDLSRTGDVEAVAPAEAKEDGPPEDVTEELDAAKTFFYFLTHCGLELFFSCFFSFFHIS
jgi:hypothetical protein